MGLAASQFNLRPSRRLPWPIRSLAGNSSNYVRLLSSSRPISTTLEPTDELIRIGNEINAAIRALGQSRLSGTAETLFDRVIRYFIYEMKKTDLDVAALESCLSTTNDAGYDHGEGPNSERIQVPRRTGLSPLLRRALLLSSCLV